MVARTTGALAVDFAPLELIVLLAGSGLLLIVSQLGQSLPPRVPEQTAQDWWRATLGRAVLAWGLLELAALLGSVSLLATRSLLGFGVLLAGALFGFVLLTPGRLARE